MRTLKYNVDDGGMIEGEENALWVLVGKCLTFARSLVLVLFLCKERERERRN